MVEKREIKPQEGFQEAFLSSSADIVIGGGSAGAGKTFAELLEPLRHKDNPRFNAVMFRRTTPQIINSGGLWDESCSIYPLLNAKSNSQKLTWVFPSKAKVKFNHLEHEQTIYDHQGSQYALIIFDELTHFTKRQFFYLLSRNRSTCGVKPYIRATCNPDPDSWVAEFIAWFIDQDTGFPIPERSGVLRYFISHNDNYVWGATKEEVLGKMPPEYSEHIPSHVNRLDLVKSMTFIPGSIYQNKKLLEVNPEYLSNLLSQDEQEKSRLLFGNWKIRTDGLSVFDFNAVNDLFSNYPNNTGKSYITCDAARFGKDLCVIAVWRGWEVIKWVIFTKSDENRIITAIEELRRIYSIGKSQVLIDQDGVGGGVVSGGGYQGFHGGGPACKEPETGIKENYKILKTQCYYRFANRVNDRVVQLQVNNENVVIDGIIGCKLMIQSKLMDIRDLIKADLRSIKKQKPDAEGKKNINPKEEQKILLGGRSPDFGDTLMMREWFELNDTEPRKIRRTN